MTTSTALATLSREAVAAAFAGASTRTQQRSVAKLTQPGTYRIRLLPAGGAAFGTPEFWRRYGLHFVPHDGRTIVFACDKWTTGLRYCPVCEAYWQLWNARKANQPVDESLWKIADKSKAGTRFLINAIIEAGPQHAKPGEPQVVDFSKVMFDKVEIAAINVNHLIFDLQQGQTFRMLLTPASNGFGNDANIVDYEPVKAVGSDASQLHDLEAALASDVLGNAYPASAFSGDFWNPLKAGTERQRAAVPALAAPSRPFPPSPSAPAVAPPVSSPVASAPAIDPATLLASLSPEKLAELLAGAGHAAPVAQPEVPLVVQAAPAPRADVVSDDDLMAELRKLAGEMGGAAPAPF